ncbi:VanW family protein [Enterococcus sp. BWB1-3]|uniref:VanW family protein n=1 Tax=unclassified Enterococcus TaxID=2608891 RepID=UPI001920886F|nr:MULTISPECIES: VanW family protein [unclassified Enterococcus]MBL1229594.1 VanW family protein [Enterococcus sp. BWB1-3]MCB5951955.1 VanW family protein [Enterococcus sp. BWT-B8]MCB5954152.1 VanW family protein [Enterococcus sp. CWB-B31]
MGRKLFCEISPTTYKLSVYKNIISRHFQDKLQKQRFASKKEAEKLPVCIYKHSSLIRRKLGNVDQHLQDNKAVNLALSTPKVSGILIRPGETFSFWKLVGSCKEKDGYQEGLMIGKEEAISGIGGGMCQFTNLIHWMVLHTPFEIVEHHHHDGVDLFPDYGRVIPFGTGTSIVYNYMDYRFKNSSDQTYQLITYTDDTHLHGELYAEKEQPYSYHVKCEDDYFSREQGIVYRNSNIYQQVIDKQTGNEIKKVLIKKNHAKVVYPTDHLTIIEK